MLHTCKKVLQKTVSTFISISVIAWSLGSPLGLLFYPQLALAAPPFPTFGGPNEGQTGIPKDALVDREFDQALDATTVNTTNVLLQANTGNTQFGTPTGSNLCTSVTLGADGGGNANRKITCAHAALSDNTWYTFKISTGVKNTSGEALQFDFHAHFQTGNFTSGGFTGGATFAPPPVVTGTVPGLGGTLPTNGKLVVSFAPGGLDPNTSTMKTSGTGSVLGPANVQLFDQVNGVQSGSNKLLASNLSWNATTKQLTITPTGLLTANNFYILIVKNTAQNTDGNTLGGTGTPDYVVPFQAVASDSTAAAFLGSFPSDGATGVDRATYDITISFTEGLDATTVSSSTIQLIEDANNDGTLNETAKTNTQVELDGDSKTVHLAPLALLTASRKHFIKIVSGASGVKDIVGNSLSADITKSFTTGTNINGAASDTVKPYIIFATGDNFEISIDFSEPMLATSTAASVDRLANYTLESPVGTAVSLSNAFIEYEAFSRHVFIRGLAVAPGQSFKITVATSTRDLVGNTIDTSGTPAKNTFTGTLGNATQVTTTGTGGTFGTGGGTIDFFTLGTNPIMVMPSSQLAGATTNYFLDFQATTSIPSGGKIVLTFPSGFSFASLCGTKLSQFDNDDINGPSPGTVTFSPSCDSNARTVTLTTSGGGTNPNDFIHLTLQGIVNSTVPKDFTTGGYTVDIKTFDVSNNLLDSKTSMPFFISTPGTQSISGFVYNDTNKNDTKDSGESGVASIEVCAGGPMIGFSCTTTGSDGSYTFSSLNDGFYHVEIPPITSAAVSAVGGFMFRDINLSGGQNSSGVNFGLKPSDATINVTVSGGPASEKVDVFAFNPYNTSLGGFVVRELTLTAAGGGTVALPVSFGTWSVSVGPWMPKTPGIPPTPPTFKFLPPPPQEVTTSSSNATVSVTFTLQTTNRTIKGTVVDGSNNGVSNVFVNARPAAASTSVFGGGFSQTKSDGTFELSIVNGTYIVEAYMPGMPSAIPVEATVQDNVSNTDNNTSADVYSGGALVTGTGITVKIAKADRSISGRVLDESGNAIAFAFINGERVDSSGNFLGQFVGAPTDNSGNYTLYVSDGTWKLRAFAPGFGDLGQKTVTVSGSNLSSQNFQVSAADFGSVSGTVFQDTDGDGAVDSGEGLAGAFVNVFGASGGNGTVTGSDGTYSVKVKTGTGYVAEGFMPGKGPLAPTAAFTVSSSGVTGKNLSLAGIGTITVTISGVTDAFVDARDATGRGFGTNSNSSGVYTLTLPASSIGVSYTVKAHNPKFGLIGSQSVALTTNATQSVAFTAPTLFTVSGTVSSSLTACVAGVSVFLTDATNGRHVVAVTGSNGTYSTSVPNGTYTLIASKPGCVDSANPGSVTVSSANVSSGTNRTMVAADATITGRVTLSGSNVTTPTFVFADNGSGRFVVAEVDLSATGTNNNYTLKVSAGTWTVKARSDGSESSGVSVSATANATATQNLTLTAISGYTIKEARSFGLKPSTGGIVKNADITNFEVNIPAGALGSSANDATISTKEKTSVVDPTSDNIDVLGDKAIEITPVDSSGNKITTLSSSSATIKIPYTQSDVPSGVDESKLAAAVWSEEKQMWEALPTTVDTVNNILIAIVTHFSDFAPIAPVGGAQAPATPSGVNAGSPGINSALVTWSAVSAATGYNIYRDTSSSGSFPRVGSDPTVNSGTQTSFTDSGLACNTAYFYKVSSKNATGESTASSAVSVTTLSCTGGGGGGGISGSGGAPVPVTAPSVEPVTPTQPTTPAPISEPVTQAAVVVEGGLVRIANAFKVFIVKAGKLLHIPNPKAFAALSLNWGNVKEVSVSEVSGFSEATLQRPAGDFKVYRVKEGRKIHIPSPEAFIKAGHNWEDIAEVDKAFIDNTPDTTLLRASDSFKVYKLEENKLRWVISPTVFNKLKLSWDEVSVVDPKELYHPVGEDLK